MSVNVWYHRHMRLSTIEGWCWWIINLSIRERQRKRNRQGENEDRRTEEIWKWRNGKTKKCSFHSSGSKVNFLSNHRIPCFWHMLFTLTWVFNNLCFSNGSRDLFILPKYCLKITRLKKKCTCFNLINLIFNINCGIITTKC